MADRKVRIKVGHAKDSKVVEAVVADSEPDPWDLDSKLRIVGTLVPRVDGPAKVAGAAKYTFDINVKGMLFARMLTSPYGAATVKSIDLAGAEKMPGVKAVHVFKEKGRPLQHDGDEILAVAAETEEQADEAVRTLKVEYEIKPCVTTIDAAMKEGAPQVFAGRSNVGEKKTQGQSVDLTLNSSPIRHEATYETQVQTHSALEPHGAVARWEEDGSLTLWCSTQATFGVREQAAQVARLPVNKVRILADHVGGGFGAKFPLGTTGVAAIELSKKAGRPVKCMLTRSDEHKLGGNRPSSRQTMKAAVSKDGKIEALDVNILGSAGVGGGAGVSNPMIYAFGNVHKASTVVYTNGGAGAPFRAPGHPQASFAMEGFLDELAEKAGLDPLAFRKKNCATAIYHAQWDLAAEKIGWAKRNKTPGAGEGVRKRGMGMASARWGQLGNHGHEVEIVMYKDGAIDVRNGAQDIGTGTKTLLAVVVAEELGVPVGSLRIVMGDTSLPPGPASGGSVTAPALAPAARTAAVEAKKAVAKLVEKDLGTSPVFADGNVSGHGKTLSLKEALARIEGDQLAVRGRREPNFKATYSGEVAGCQFAEVEVDVETGRVRVLKVVALQDAGRVVDRLTFESQVVGGVVQGLSYALFEDRVLDPRFGSQLNADFLHYKIAGSKDMPEIEAIAFDVSNGANNVGLAGLGEPPTIPTAAAIANAVYNASGARVRSLPITPARVLAALKR